MTQVAFGVFDHLEARPGQAPRDTYAGRIRLAQAAEAAGFHAWQVAEHHFTPLGLAPSPNVFLAALAQSTTRIRLGSLVHLLPLYTPVRLAEEVAMLDHLSGGRLDLGVGRGVSPFELGHYGVDFLDRDVFTDALDALIAGLTRPALHHRSEHFRYRGAPMVIAPLQKPLPPLWYGVTSESSVELAARYGMHVVGLAPAGVIGGLAARYRELRAQHRGGPQDCAAPGSEPRIGALRQIVVGRDDAHAQDLAARAYPVFYENLMHLWRQFNVVNTLIPPTVQVAQDLGTALVGGPAAVRDQLRALLAESGCNYVALEFVFGDLTDAEALDSITRFGAQVMPAFAD